MKHLIDKDDIVTEIERRIKTLNERLIKRPISSPTLEKLIEENKKVLFFLDTLEVKKVDLESEIERIRKYHYINGDFEKAEIDGRTITNIAKYFFELGLKAQKGE
jgi:hypothetical protein